MRGYVLIHTAPGEELEVVKMIRRAPGILRAEFTFGPYDVIAEVEAGDLDSLGRLVSGTIRASPGVRDTLTCLAVG